MSLPEIFLNFQPAGAKTVDGIFNWIAALIPASSIPLWPPLRIWVILVVNFGEFKTRFKRLKVNSSSWSCVYLPLTV